MVGEVRDIGRVLLRAPRRCVTGARSAGSGGAAGVGNHTPECFEVRFPARTADAATTTSGRVSELCGAIRPQVLRRPGLRTAVGLPTRCVGGSGARACL